MYTETCPRIFFTGNQTDFGHKIVEGSLGQRCLLVSLPPFANKGSAALVNLRTLECNEIVFDVKSITGNRDEGMRE
jgi:DNA polymerase delta subunit 2